MGTWQAQPVASEPSRDPGSDAPRPDQVERRTNASEFPSAFGRYALIRRLAVGGMAELFIAMQRSMAGFEKVLVIKRILPHLAMDPQFVQLLLQEARIAATLSHPNIAHIFDVGREENHYYIAMEHVHGEDLKHIVQQMRASEVPHFPLEHALNIVLGACAALAYAHEKTELTGEPLGIVHRDVSPQNVLVTFSGDIKLVDFGIAKVANNAVELTQDGKLRGKVPYMSPEQVRGEPLDRRSDIFSLGVLLFELCTGQRLFRAPTEEQAMEMILSGDYPDPKVAAPYLPDGLAEVITRALTLDREQRYASARDMQRDLEAVVRDAQLEVSAIGLGTFMRALFADKLKAQIAQWQSDRAMVHALAEAEAQRLPTSSAPPPAPTEQTPRPTTHRPHRREERWPKLALLAMTAAFLAFVLQTMSDRSAQDTSPAPLTVQPETGPLSTRRPDPQPTLPSARKTAALRVEVTPADARVRLDGEWHEQGSPYHFAVTPGQHALKFEAEGYVFARRFIRVAAGEMETVIVHLAEAPPEPPEGSEARPSVESPSGESEGGPAKTSVRDKAGSQATATSGDESS